MKNNFTTQNNITSSPNIQEQALDETNNTVIEVYRHYKYQTVANILPEIIGDKQCNDEQCMKIAVANANCKVCIL